MKLVPMVSAFVVTVALYGCGGSSESSTSSSTTNNSGSGSTTQTTVAACAVSGTNVTVTTAGCTQSSPNVNGGAAQTYKCDTNNMITINGNKFSSPFTINSYTYKCAV